MLPWPVGIAPAALVDAAGAALVVGGVACCARAAPVNSTTAADVVARVTL